MNRSEQIHREKVVAASIGSVEAEGLKVSERTKEKLAQYAAGKITAEALKMETLAPYLTCDFCGMPALKPEHAHYKCSNCGARTSCCEGAPQ